MSTSVSCGIVGLPNAGKSTLFNALTNNKVLAANYPFATIEPNVGIVPVPDKRLSKLSSIYKTEKVTPASVKFIDIAGLIAGASQGEGLGNQFLSHIRQCDLICHVVREFNPANLAETENQNESANDLDIINTELALADLDTVNRRLSLIEKQAKADPKLKPVVDNLKLAKDHLEEGKSVVGAPEIDLEQLKDLNLLSAKPVIYVFNVDEEVMCDQAKQTELKKMIGQAPAVFINAQIESEINELSKSEAKELLDSYGQTESGLSQLVKAAYQMLGLQSFLTAGPKEVRAWTIKVGSNAQQAAGVIHTDFAKGFIAAEVISYKDLIELGSVAKAKQLGKVRTEGRQYIMQPDDVVEFRFNV